MIVPSKFQKEMYHAIIGTRDDINHTITSSDSKNVVICAARGTGKTFMMSCIIVEVLQMFPNISICFYSLSDATSSDRFNEVSQFTQSSDWSVTSNKIVFKPLNSFVQFKPVASVNSSRGPHYHCIIIDEAAFCHEHPILHPEQSVINNVIRPLLLNEHQDGGKIPGWTNKFIFISTPSGSRGTGKIFYEQFNKAQSHTPGYSLVYCPFDKWLSDRGLSPQDIEYEVSVKKSEVSELAYLQEFACQFIEGGCSFFNINDYQSHFIDTFTFDVTNGLFLGMDPNNADNDPGVITLMDTHGNVIQHYCTVKTGLHRDVYADFYQFLKPYLGYILNAHIEANNPANFHLDFLDYITHQGSNIPDWSIYRGVKWNHDNKYQHCSDLRKGISNLTFESTNDQLKLQLDNFIEKPNHKLENSSPEVHDDAVCSLVHCYQAFLKYDSGVERVDGPIAIV